MFDPLKPIIRYKSQLMPRIQRGELVLVTQDIEGGGIDRQNVPYATPNYSLLSEIAMTTTCVSGNYLHTASILPRRPEWLEADAVAQIVTRLKKGGFDLDDPNRIPDVLAASSYIHHMREQTRITPEMAQAFGFRRRKDFSYVYHDAQLKHGHEVRGSDIYEVPMIDDKTGEVVYDAFYDINEHQVFFAFDREYQGPDSDYSGYDNQYGVDEEGRCWKGVEPTVGSLFFNGRYDIPRIRMWLARNGMAPIDTTFLYARAAPGPVQQAKWHYYDARTLAYATVLHGPQGANGLNFGQLIDPETGKVRNSEALARYLEEKTGHPNPLRLVAPGAYMPDTGEFHDKQKDHGGAYDTLGTVALYNTCRDLAPWIDTIHANVADKKSLANELRKQNPDGKNYPLYSLPYRQAGVDHSETIYAYLGEDSQLGEMKKELFLLVDGTLTDKLKTKIWAGKPLMDLSSDEWAAYMSSSEFRHDSDKLVRDESTRYLETVIPFHEVIQHSTQGKRYRARTTDIKKDMAFLGRNQQIIENIKNAVEINNHKFRFRRHFPQTPLYEDEMGMRYARDVYYPVHEEAKTKLYSSFTSDTDRSIFENTEMIKNAQTNVLRFCQKIDTAMGNLVKRSALIDHYKDFALSDMVHQEKDEDGHLTPRAERALQALEEFKQLCERQLNILSEETGRSTEDLDQPDAKEKPYVEVLKSIKKPNGDPYFEGRKFKATTVGEAIYFRKKLLEYAIWSATIMFREKSDHEYVQGYVDKDFCFQSYKGKRLLLFADPHPGERRGSQEGPAPHLVDEQGREIPEEKIIALASRSNGRDLVRKLVDEGTWNIRFYRFRSEYPALSLVWRAIEMGYEELITPELQDIFHVDRMNRKLGFSNETPTQSRMTTLRTNAHELNQLVIATGGGTGPLIERASNAKNSMAAEILKYPEGPRTVAQAKQINENKIREEIERLATVFPGAFEPETGLPYDFIPHQIDRDSSADFLKDSNFIVLDISVYQAQFLIEQYDIDHFAPRGLVLPNIPKNIRAHINRGKDVVFRVKETGQIYGGVAGPGQVSIKELPRNKGGFDSILQKACEDLDRAGTPVQDEDRLFYIEIQNLYPIAGTKKIDHSHQTLHVPHLPFYGTTAPGFANFGSRHITTIIAPVDYLAQHFELDKPLLLLHTDAPAYATMTGEDGKASGHSYQTTLADTLGVDKATGTVEGITVAEYENLIRGSDIDHRFVDGAGILGADHFVSLQYQWATKGNRNHPEQQKIAAFTFERVGRGYFEGGREDETLNPWGLTHLFNGPDLALRIDGLQLSPSAYRDTSAYRPPAI